METQNCLNQYILKSKIAVAMANFEFSKQHLLLNHFLEDAET